MELKTYIIGHTRTDHGDVDNCGVVEVEASKVQIRIFPPCEGVKVSKNEEQFE